MTTTRPTLAAVLLAWCSVTGCDGVVPGSTRQIDPKLIQEAQSQSPECVYPAWMLEKRETYTKEEFERRSAATEACNQATDRYIRAKLKARGG